MKNMTAKFLALVMLLALAGASSCTRKPDAAMKKDNNVDYYTCAMHPSVHLHNPGTCPICSMDLLPVMKRTGGEAKTDATPGTKNTDATASEKPNEFVVPVERQQQIGVTYATVGRKPLHHSIRAVGTVNFDMQRRWSFVARVDGYVQKLFVTSPGQLVAKDQALISIYSPDLLTTEREFVMLLRMRDEAPSKEARETPESLIASAKIRLKQWNVTDGQIAELEKTRKPGENLTLRSPFRGVIQEVAVQQGANVKTGDRLVDVADLSSVWVWADFYENELAMLQKGQKVIVTAKSFPEEKFEGEIALINPFLNEMGRTSKVRIDIPNPDFKLQPGMYASVELGMDMGEGLTVPVSAIMPTGRRNVVFVDKGEGKIEPRVVQLGQKFGDLYEVKDGLTEGERVVASANFLIDAESKLQGALKDFEGPDTMKPEEKR